MSALKSSTNLQNHHEIEKTFFEIEQLLENEAISKLPVQKIAHLKSLLNAYEQSPRALDTHLQQYVSAISSLYFTAKQKVDVSGDSVHVPDSLADLIYVLAKSRGYKSVANHLSSDVYLILQLVKFIEDPKISQCHSELYFLLLWLSRLVLVPFPLSSVHSKLDWQLYTIASKHLSVHSTASKTQVISLAFLALLITRPDCGELFTEYAEKVVVDWPVITDENAKLGHLMTLNQILKKSMSGPISDLIEEIHNSVILHDISRVKYDEGASKINTLNALYLIKISAKLSKFYIGKNQYTHIASFINLTTDIMHLMGDVFDATLRECMAKNLSKTVSFLRAKAINYASQVVAYMFKQLRVSGLHADAGFVSDLSLDPSNLSVPRYHTVLLFLGFLALIRALPEEFEPTVFSIIHRTFFVSQRNFAFVQTSQLRDASCFCAWVLFRMLSKQRFSHLQAQYPLLISIIFLDVVKVSIFDEDFTMRRSGIAVLQELIGRFGGEFLGKMLGISGAFPIGEFTIKFIEQFGASTVGSLCDSHEVMHALVEMGFSPDLFLQSLLDEILADLSSFALQKLGSHHLAKVLSAQNSFWVNLQTSENLTPHLIVEILLLEFKRGSYSALYALAEIEDKREILAPEEANEVSFAIQKTALKHHSYIFYWGEAIMHWLNCAFHNSDKSQHFPKFASLIVTIQRLDASESLVKEFETFFRLSPSLSADQFSSICHQIRTGSKLLAASITLATLCAQQIRAVCEILIDKAVDADARANLISTIKNDWFHADGVSFLVPSIVELLDDYTVSEQGDVGLKVRYACVQLIPANMEHFLGAKVALDLKLLRISGETIDRLKVAAFSALWKLCRTTDYSENKDKYNSDYDLYFGDLLDFFDFHVRTCPSISLANDLKNAFWSGLVHSAGTSTGANTMINQSFRRILSYLRHADNMDATVPVLLKFLKVPPGVKVSSLDRRTQKTLQATMNLLVKILDAGMELPEPIHYESLFVRAYNLHINTSVMARLSLVTKIFQHISVTKTGSAGLKSKARKRLCWLCCHHTSGQARGLAADSLFEIINEVDPSHQIVLILDSTAWEAQNPDPTIEKQLENVFLSI